MKKVLFATTALVLSAGIASAEVAVTGAGRMGLVYDSISGDTVFSSRIRIIFTASGETDGGLSFGASVRNDQSGVGNAANGDSTVYVSGAFGKVTFGDVGGAPDALVGQVSGVGFGPNDALQEIGFLGTDKTAMYYEYSAGAITFGLGAGQTNGPNKNLNVAVKYAGPTWSVAVGYEDSNTDTQLSAKGTATFGAATVKAKVVDQDSNPDLAYAVSLDYAMAGATVTGFYTDFGGSNVQHLGLGASYDLGGGASVVGGIVRQMNPTPVGDETFADIGMKFAF
jgi:outer membrane protein OmpU